MSMRVSGRVSVGRRFLRDRRGQALVEFALVMPVLLILLIGIIEFARAWNAHQAITDAAREGARQAVVFDKAITQDSVTQVVERAIANAGFDPDAATVSYPLGFKTGTGQITAVRIVLPYRFAFLRPLISFATDRPDGTVRLVTEARMRNE